VRQILNKGVRRPIPFNSKWNVNGGLYGSGTSDRFTYMQSMSMEGTLFAIIQLLSTGAQAYGGWQMFRKDTDGRVRYAKTDKGSDQRVEVMRHQALKLWNRPNPFMTGEQFREIGWQHMELAGEWYWVLNRGPSGKSLPIEMWPVRPDRMEPVPDKEEFLAGWVYTGPNGEAVPLLTSEVIQLRYPHPTDLYRGLSAVQAVLADIDASKYTAEWSRNFFLNSAQPGGIVTFAKRLSDPEFSEFTDRWRQQHQGVARGHRVGVLEQGATWTPNTYSMRDMQFPELRQVTSTMIRQGYRIHQAMLGNSDDVNRANAQTAEEVHVAWHEIPRLDRVRGVLNNNYLEMFGDQDSVEFDYKDPRPTSSEDANDELIAKSTAAVMLVEAGFAPEEVLEMVGLPAMTFSGPPAGALGLPPGGAAGPSTPGQKPPSKKAPQPGQRPPLSPGPGHTDPTKTDALLARKSAETKVYKQLAKDYPPEAMAWVHHADWKGPLNVPIDHIDPDMAWMDDADPNHVEDFQKMIRDGERLKPVILVKIPDPDDDGLLDLADGHHRYLACAEEGVPVRAFIATVHENHGPWEVMHESQRPKKQSSDGPSNSLDLTVDLGTMLREAFHSAKSNGHQKEVVS
jgi:HK97 family phage portal protein